MLTGIPLVSVNINSIRSDYVSILQTSNNYDETVCLCTCGLQLYFDCIVALLVFVCSEINL